MDGLCGDAAGDEAEDEGEHGVEVGDHAGGGDGGGSGLDDHADRIEGVIDGGHLVCGDALDCP